MTATSTTIDGARAELTALGREGRPWRFVPAVIRHLDGAAPDDELRLLLATSYARLGLVTAALEQLDRLGDGPFGRAADQLRAVVASQPPDEIEPAARLATARRNASVLALRGIDLTEACRAWGERTKDERWFRTTDGNIVRRRAGDGPESIRWLRFADEVTMARGVEAPTTGSVYLEGIDPPWLLKHLSERSRRAGAAVRLDVIQVDLDGALDGLGAADLRSVLEDDRVFVHAGPDAYDHFEAALRRRLGSAIQGPCCILPRAQERGSGRLKTIVRDAIDAQRREDAEIRVRLENRLQTRDPAWWARRYDDADRACGAPLARARAELAALDLRLCRAAEDLVASLTALGCDAHLLLEDEGEAGLAPLAVLRAVETVDPDLVVLINYPRRGSHVPEGIPFICWIQDPMTHLFDREVGRAQGPLDFLVGYLYDELFDLYEYPRERTWSCPVVASDRKFHPGAAPAAADVAYVSHQGETPDALHARLVEASGAAPLLQQLMAALREPVLRAAAHPETLLPDEAIPALVRRVVRERTGRDPDERIARLLQRSYCEPLAERAVRHETLDWAAGVAERHGWTLAIHGRGWEDHPTLGRYAAGTVRHGEALRRVYAGAGVNLHMSVHRLSHQRVLECILSGGLPLCRLNAAALAQRDVDAVTAPSARRWPSALSLLDSPDCFFATRDELERSLLAMLGDPPRRRAISTAAAGRVRARYTHDVLAHSMIDTVRRSLHAGRADPARFVGSWRSVPEADSSFTSPWRSMTCRTIGETIIEGTFVGADGLEGRLTLAYVSATDRFEGTWLAGDQDRIVFLDGSVNAAGDRIALRGRTLDGEAWSERFRTEMITVDDDAFIVAFHRPGADGSAPAVSRTTWSRA